MSGQSEQGEEVEGGKTGKVKEVNRAGPVVFG